MHAFAREGRDVPRLMEELLFLRRADTLGKAPSCFYYVDMLMDMLKRVRGLIEEGVPYCTKMLDLDGRDLIAVGVKPGPDIGELLDRAVKACMEGNVENSKAALIHYLHLDSQGDHK